MNYKLIVGIGIVIIAIFIIVSNQEPNKIQNTQNSTSLPEANSSLISQGKQLQLTLSDSVGIKAK